MTTRPSGLPQRDSTGPRSSRDEVSATAATPIELRAGGCTDRGRAQQGHRVERRGAGGARQRTAQEAAPKVRS